MALTQRKIALHYGNLRADAALLRSAVASVVDDCGTLLIRKEPLRGLSLRLDEIAADLLAFLPDMLPPDEMPIESLDVRDRYDCPTHGLQENETECPVCLSLAEGGTCGTTPAT